MPQLKLLEESISIYFKLIFSHLIGQSVLKKFTQPFESRNNNFEK